jgi:hypothetical protein
MTFTHQGRLLDAAGGPLEGAHAITVALYDAEQGGAPVWWEAHPAVPVNQGHYAVVVGSISSLDAADLAGERWLGLSVDGAALGARQPLTAVPFAVRAAEAELATSALTATTLGGGAVSVHPTGGLRVGNAVYGAWSGGVPGAFNGQGYASGALQMKTALTCGNGQGQSYMWHVEFAGHDYLANTPFRTVSVGYSQSSYPDEIQNLGTVKDYGNVNVNPYCSTDDFLCFELTRGGGGQWHASDMVVNLLHGGSGYERNFTNGFRVTALREGSRY